MKKFYKSLVMFCIIVITITGCGIKSNKDILNELTNKIEKSNSYYLKGIMEIINNENTYTYDVEVSYMKDDYYKIKLLNKLNNHEQIILRNEEGVYVVTPSLNKSFKFQSDWPYNNSQVYLLNSILDDLKEDENREFKIKKDIYYYTSKVNYPNNKKLIKQNVYIDKNLKIKKVEIIDKDKKPEITMTFDKIIYNKKYPEDYFELSKLIKQNNKKEETTEEELQNNNNNNNDTNNNRIEQQEEEQKQNKTTSESNENETKQKQTATINDVVYPMYLPNNTTLANKEIVNTNDGERVILTFSGDNPFVLVEETATYSQNGEIIPVSGNPDFLNDVIGVIADNSVSFSSNGIEYYIVSDNLKQTELVNIAKSISILPVSK